jgi:MoaA/NifB/PqqE/SkfB family radical SAM enzyme
MRELNKSVSKKNISKIAGADKIGYHIDKICDYMENRAVFPVTLEIDLSTECSRRCPGCATTLRPLKKALETSFIENLFSYFANETKGLLLAGGEPTIAPNFSHTLKLARKYGFANIAIISNGAHLDDCKITDSIVTYASCIRVSINYSNPTDYGNSFGCDPSELQRILNSIEKLRKKIDAAKSKVQIGVSTLTSERNYSQLDDITQLVKNAGAHWIYFHPNCLGWKTGNIVLDKQNGIFKLIGKIREKNQFKFPVFTFDERYQNDSINFTNYHSTYFLLMIGADKKIYLGPEAKYQRDFQLCDLTNWVKTNFLNESEFKDKIRSFSSDHKKLQIKSKSRAILYNHIIERIISKDLDPIEMYNSSHIFDPNHLHIL